MFSYNLLGNLFISDERYFVIRSLLCGYFLLFGIGFISQARFETYHIYLKNPLWIVKSVQEAMKDFCLFILNTTRFNVNS